MSPLMASRSGWLLRVQAGRFDAVPDALSWYTSAEFAHLIDGYALSRQTGLGHLADLANARFDQAREDGRWTGTPIELWCCLFFEHRRYRHMGEGDPIASDLDLLDRLCARLRQQLRDVADDERRTLLAALRRG